MSRAFVKESSESARPPERMVDDGPNLVTPQGLAMIEGQVARIEAALKTETNVLLRETLERDLRYWSQRKASAELVQPAQGETAAFGSTVTIARDDRRQTFRIVGVDEADVRGRPYQRPQSPRPRRHRRPPRRHHRSVPAPGRDHHPGDRPDRLSSPTVHDELRHGMSPIRQDWRRRSRRRRPGFRASPCPVPRQECRCRGRTVPGCDVPG